MNLTGQKGFIGVEIDNLNIQGLLRDLKGYEKESEKAIDKAVTDTAKAIQTDAKDRLRSYLAIVGEYVTSKSGRKTQAKRGHGGSGLTGSIYNRVVKSMEKVVGSNKHYAPYIEFGTGDLVFTNFDFDNDAKEVAAQFKGKGIRKVNIKGGSFLNWAAVNQQKKLIERIETNLNAINK